VLLGLFFVHALFPLFSVVAFCLESGFAEGCSDADDLEVSETGQVEVFLRREARAVDDAPKVDVLALLIRAYVGGDFEAFDDHVASLLFVVHLKGRQVFELERKLEKVVWFIERDDFGRVWKLAGEEQREDVSNLVSRKYFFALSSRHFGQVLDDGHGRADALRAQDGDGREAQLVVGTTECVRVCFEFLDVHFGCRQHGTDEVRDFCAVHDFEDVARSMVIGRVKGSIVFGGTSSSGAKPK